jgi:hypothetical protein
MLDHNHLPTPAHLISRTISSHIKNPHFSNVQFRKEIVTNRQGFEISSLQYFIYKDFGERSKQEFNYSQAVRIGDRIKVSSQGLHHLLTRIDILLI